MMRHYSPFDRFLIQADTALRTLAGKPSVTQRDYPADNIEECELSDYERKHIASLMRINHAGEVSAQALYQGQSLTSRNPEIREKLEQAALREVLEETGLVLPRIVFNRCHEIIMKDKAGDVERHFVLAMFVGISDAGEATAGDDAAAVEWFTIGDLENVALTGHTMTFVRESLVYLPKLSSR